MGVEVGDGVILSSSSPDLFVTRIERRSVQREGERKRQIERMTEICHQVDRSVSERDESKVGNDSIGMLLQR